MFVWLKTMVKNAVLAGVNEALVELANGQAAAEQPEPTVLLLPAPTEETPKAKKGGKQ